MYIIGAIIVAVVVFGIPSWNFTINRGFYFTNHNWNWDVMVIALLTGAVIGLFATWLKKGSR